MCGGGGGEGDQHRGSTINNFVLSRVQQCLVYKHNAILLVCGKAFIAVLLCTIRVKARRNGGTL